MAVLVSLDDAEDAFLGDHLRAVGAGDGRALIRRQFFGALLRTGRPGRTRPTRCGTRQMPS